LACLGGFCAKGFQVAFRKAREGDRAFVWICFGQMGFINGQFSFCRLPIRGFEAFSDLPLLAG
jgi:hypothetical protein